GTAPAARPPRAWRAPTSHRRGRVTGSELLDWARACGPADRSVVVALAEVIAAADEHGAVGRAEWLAALRGAYEGTAPARVDGSGFPLVAENGEPVAAYVEDHVVARLEAAAI